MSVELSDGSELGARGGRTSLHHQGKEESQQL